MVQTKVRDIPHRFFLVTYVFSLSVLDWNEFLQLFWASSGVITYSVFIDLKAFWKALSGNFAAANGNKTVAGGLLSIIVRPTLCDWFFS